MSHVALLLHVRTVFSNDFGRYFLYLTGHRRNAWLALMEPLGAVEPRLKTTVLQLNERLFNIYAKFFFIFSLVVAIVKKQQ